MLYFLLQRYATVEEVAVTIVFLASEKASTINGAAQRVEGGSSRVFYKTHSFNRFM
ncbi:SDR family oxidoreductase [Rossellomorea aquimaris]|uniref:SDR family oxidoreductase n=1 Tax=Rossellomorea aquimaris TaxID=189382 RepID=UPI003F5922BE